MPIRQARTWQSGACPWQSVSLAVVACAVGAARVDRVLGEDCEVVVTCAALQCELSGKSEGDQCELGG